MHKLIDYICEELEELERKAEKDGKLSMAEIQYVDTLAHAKKNLMKAEEFSMDDGSYRMDSYARGGGGRGGRSSGSYARGGRRGGANQYGSYAMEGYSRETEDMIMELRELMNEAPDGKTRKEFERFIHKIEQM